jgi:hypothetical protein
MGLTLGLNLQRLSRHALSYMAHVQEDRRNSSDTRLAGYPVSFLRYLRISNLPNYQLFHFLSANF